MYGVILAGGAGTRLWPRSRAYWPKFLLKFGEHSLLQECFLRLSSFISPEKIFVVANVEHKFLIKENITDLGIKYPEANIIVEPFARNTAPAIALASRYIVENCTDDPVIICPSDHLIKDSRKFAAVVKKSVPAAYKNKIVIFGIKPSRPETGYGYIKFGRKTADGTYTVERFTEKPSVEKARSYIKDKNFYWNAGIFLFKPSVILDEMRKYIPRVYSGILRYDFLSKENYKKIESISIDIGVMEKTKNIVASKLDVKWDDLGDWNSMERVYAPDSNGNIFEGKVVAVDSRNTTVLGSKRMIAALGLKNLVIVDTEDALLVCDKNESQRVKEVVGKISAQEEALYHKNVSRPWGEYMVLEKGKDYKVKVIHVLPRKKLSLQKHKRRSEHWLVVDGTALVTKGSEKIVIKKGQMIEIPVFTTHRLENLSNKTLRLIEISRGKYIGEDDIIRIEDDFNRR